MLNLLALLVPVLALLAPHAGVAFAFYGRDRGGVAGRCLVLTSGTSKASKGTSNASKRPSKASKEVWLGAVWSSPQVLVKQVKVPVKQVKRCGWALSGPHWSLVVRDQC
jgi:hypothetical protein